MLWEFSVLHQLFSDIIWSPSFNPTLSNSSVSPMIDDQFILYLQSLLSYLKFSKLIIKLNRKGVTRL